MLRFRLLGPVEAWVGEHQVPLGGSKPRALLAALLLAHGRVISTDRLVDVVWADRPPPTARALVQTYVSTLRRTFAQVGVPDLIQTRPPGYVLSVPRDALDRDVFERLVARCPPDEDPRAAVDRLGAALVLWHGPALAGVRSAVLAGEANRLDQLRRTALEERIDADLALGRFAELVPELTALVDEQPTNERWCAQLMIALAQLGRQADALAVYHRGRGALATELGIDPGPGLTGLFHAVLEGSLPTAATSAPPRPARSNLPPVPTSFVGRAVERDALVRGAAIGLQVISGPAGTGKSTLAAVVARQLAEGYPDAQLYAELNGMSDAPAHPGEVLGRFLRTLGVDPASVPQTVGERRELYRTMLAGRRVLVVLDDARDERQVRPLLPDTGGCTTIITSRERLTALSDMALTELDVFDREDALALLGRLVGATRLAEDRAAADRIIEHCGRLPLAIRIASVRLIARGRLPLRWLADRLADESRRLNELSPGAQGVRASVSLSYARLDAAHRAALRLLGFLGVPDFAPWLVDWLTGGLAVDVETLVDANLVEFVGIDQLGALRYRLHDLVRLYARERAELEECHADLAAAVTRAMTGWLTLIMQNARATPPDDIRWRAECVELPDVVLPKVADPRAWFEAEQQSLVAGVERAAALGLHELACAMAPDQYSAVLAGASRFDMRTRIIEAALAAARRAGDRCNEANMLADFGQLRYLQDRFVEARQHFRAALARFRELGDPRGQAASLAGLGVSYREPGRLADAVSCLDQAAALVRELGDDTGIGYVTRMSGSVRLEQGRFEAARADLAEALAGYRRAGSRRGAGLTLRTLSMVHRAVGELDHSLELGTLSRVLFRALGDELLEAYAARAVAKTLVRLGRCDEALAPLQWSLSVSRHTHDRFGQAATLRVLGELHLANGGLDQAEACLDAAMALWTSLDTPVWIARTERDLAEVYRARGELERAAATRARAVEVFRCHGCREYAELTASESTA